MWNSCPKFAHTFQLHSVYILSVIEKYIYFFIRIQCFHSASDMHFSLNMLSQMCDSCTFGVLSIDQHVVFTNESPSEVIP
jgi:hypothetical protein